MTENKAFSYENKFGRLGIKGIDSKKDGLKYFIDDDRKGIIICGLKGMVGLSLSQAKMLAIELPGILEMFFT